MRSISVMVFNNSECSLYAVFDVEESRCVYLTNWIGYFEAMTVESGVIVNDMVKKRFRIVLKDN